VPLPLRVQSSDIAVSNTPRRNGRLAASVPVCAVEGYAGGNLPVLACEDRETLDTRLIMESNRIGPIIGDRLQMQRRRSRPLDEGKAAAGLRCQSGFGFWPNSAHAASPSELLARHPDAGGYCAARCQAELGSKGKVGGAQPFAPNRVTPTAHCRVWVESRASDKEGANGRLLRWPGVGSIANTLVGRGLLEGLWPRPECLDTSDDWWRRSIPKLRGALETPKSTYHALIGPARIL
jgi:hypothetical protein